MYKCPKCSKEYKLKGFFERHVTQHTEESLPQPTLQITSENTPLKFIDLFCGIGGFHQALAALGHTGVFASDIDTKCQEVYKDNYGLLPRGDITKIKSEEIPDFDILCSGNPCTSFSHAGKQMGFEDTRGTLFYEVFRILREKKPKYFILENVKNLKGHDGGKTWAIIYKCLLDSGYTTSPEPIVLSPHHLGIPQHRERVFIIGKRADLGALPTLSAMPKVQPSSIESILLPDEQVPKGFAISQTENQTLELWSKFVDHFKAASIKLPTFPLWSDDWDSTYEIKDLPGWKQKFIKQNREFYLMHKQFLEGWLATARANPAFSGAKRKFEWQCGAFKQHDTMWQMLFQFRPSGIRVKRPTYSPALVAMAQIVIVGSKRRRLCPREVARLQSFPDTFRLPTSTSVAYKQFGNAVNVDVVKYVAELLLKN